MNKLPFFHIHRKSNLENVPSPLLLMVHGYGSNEEDLFSFSRAIPEKFTIISIRGDIEIQYTGLRPGEKLFEELLIGNNTSSTENQMILRAKEEMIEWKKLEQMLLKLEDAIQIENYEKIRNLLMGIVPQFKPQCEISDIIYEEKINL